MIEQVVLDVQPCQLSGRNRPLRARFAAHLNSVGRLETMRYSSRLGRLRNAMPVSVRYFWVDDKEGIHRFPASRFYRVFAGEEPAPEFSGKKIRFVEAAIETENRRPIAILRLIYPLIAFNESGVIDEELQELERRDSVGLMASHWESRAEGNLLRSGGRFEKKQFDARFRWSVNPELERSIVKQVFSD